MFALVLVKPMPMFLGRFESVAAAASAAAAFSVNNGNIEVWIFDPSGKLVA